MSTRPHASNGPGENPSSGSTGFLVFSWLFVGLPLAWGVVQTLIKSMALFH
jgi:hypothetical protein